MSYNAYLAEPLHDYDLMGAPRCTMATRLSPKPIGIHHRTPWRLIQIIHKHGAQPTEENVMTEAMFSHCMNLVTRFMVRHTYLRMWTEAKEHFFDADNTTVRDIVQFVEEVKTSVDYDTLDYGACTTGAFLELTSQFATLHAHENTMVLAVFTHGDTTFTYTATLLDNSTHPMRGLWTLFELVGDKCSRADVTLTAKELIVAGGVEACLHRAASMLTDWHNEEKFVPAARIGATGDEIYRTWTTYRSHPDGSQWPSVHPCLVDYGGTIFEIGNSIQNGCDQVCVAAWRKYNKPYMLWISRCDQDLPAELEFHGDFKHPKIQWESPTRPVSGGEPNTEYDNDRVVMRRLA